MKYILFTTTLLFYLIGCQDPDSDPKPKDTPSPTTSSPTFIKCQALETVYAAYNKFLTCAGNIRSSKELEKIAECFVNFKATYDTIPTNITTQMNYFSHLHNIKFIDFEGKTRMALYHPIPPSYRKWNSLTDEEKDRAREDLANLAPEILEASAKSHPWLLCISNKRKRISVKYIYPTGNDPDGYAEMCFKELGNKAYQENKIKFNCS